MGESGSGSGLGNGRGQASALPGFQQTSTGTFNSPPNSREALREVARETQEVVGRILEQLGTTEKAESSSQYNLDTLRRLNPFFCPAFSTPTKIQVLNEDTLNAGLALLPSTTNQDPLHDNPRPLVVNFARHDKPGGGWLNGALAQEEALCYRSSLWKSLPYTAQHPLPRGDAIYSPHVMVVRDELGRGHRLLPGIRPLTAPPPSSASSASPPCATRARRPSASRAARARRCFSRTRIGI